MFPVVKDLRCRTALVSRSPNSLFYKNLIYPTTNQYLSSFRIFATKLVEQSLFSQLLCSIEQLFVRTPPLAAFSKTYQPSGLWSHLKKILMVNSLKLIKQKNLRREFNFIFYWFNVKLSGFWQHEFTKLIFSVKQNILYIFHHFK